MSKTHKLKCLPVYFDSTWKGEKTFELRVNDRNFRHGDVVVLEEWTKKDGYTQRFIMSIICYIIQDEEWLKPNVCCLGLTNFEYVDEKEQDDPYSKNFVSKNLTIN